MAGRLKKACMTDAEISQTASWLKRRATERPPIPVNDGMPSRRLTW